MGIARREKPPADVRRACNSCSSEEKNLMVLPLYTQEKIANLKQHRESRDIVIKLLHLLDKMKIRSKTLKLFAD